MHTIVLKVFLETGKNDFTEQGRKTGFEILFEFIDYLFVVYTLQERFYNISKLNYPE